MFAFCSTSAGPPLAEDILNTFDDVCGHGCRKAHLALKKNRAIEETNANCWTVGHPEFWSFCQFRYLLKFVDYFNIFQHAFRIWAGLAMLKESSVEETSTSQPEQSQESFSNFSRHDAHDALPADLGGFQLGSRAKPPATGTRDATTSRETNVETMDVCKCSVQTCSDMFRLCCSLCNT